MFLRTTALLFSLRLFTLLLSRCASSTNSPANIATKYAVLKHQEKYTDAATLATPKHAMGLQWISEQKSKQTSRIIEPWIGIKAASRKSQIDGDLATVDVVVEGSDQQTPHWCLGTVELQRLEDTWKVEDSTMTKCGSNSLPPE